MVSFEATVMAGVICLRTVPGLAVVLMHLIGSASCAESVGGLSIG